MFATGASEASGTKYNGTNTYQYQTLITICKSQDICLPVERQSNNCPPIQPNGSTLCHTTKVVETQDNMSPKIKLKDVTFVLGDKPMSNLLWCNKVPKGKRNKPAKINGVQHSEVSNAVEHTYYQPVN